MIHAPFNFVPLSNDVYYPTWANHISLDIPFEKSYTGYLEFTITAKSPIFVRNGNSKKQKEAVRELCKLASNRLNNEIARTLHIKGSLNKDHEPLILSEMQKNKRKWDQKFTELLHEEATKAHKDLSDLLFSNIQGLYFIPSTSIKGCVRNALEILSFGKIKDRLSDDKYGFREMTNLYLNGMKIENIHFKYRISDCVEQRYSDKPDLAECIFGRIKDDAFKGRVQFSNAFTDKIEGEQLVERLILSSPKASYYPMYLEQSSGRLKSYQDETAAISGWKKYPIRKNTSLKNTNNANLDSFMIPLDKETTFTCRMNFFNLKGAELGALLSVLTFHGSTDDYYLSIGQGKPYGYGKIKITPTQLCINNELVTGKEIREKSIIYMRTFESNLIRTLRTQNSKFLNWHDSNVVKEFYTMSYDVLEASNSLLQYMNLEDFSNCKRNGEYLHRFSKICESSKTPESLLELKPLI